MVKKKSLTRRWRVERAKQVLELYEQGWLRGQIAKRYQTSLRSVDRLLMLARKGDLSVRKQPKRCPDLEELLANVWTMDQLATKLEVTQRTIRSWVAGYRQVDPTTRKKISQLQKAAPSRNQRDKSSPGLARLVLAWRKATPRDKELFLQLIKSRNNR
ncbi:MAG: helix-turn-helix domain-containing protein [Acidobacteriota bacterium]